MPSCFGIIARYLILSCFVIMFIACHVNKQLLTLQDSKKAGFISDGSYVLQDPPQGKSRIYVYRDNGLVGSYLGYTIRIEYNPKTDKKGRPNYQNYQDSLGYVMNGRTFFADIWAGHTVAISAHTESTSYILFTPMEGQIYCIRANMKNGFTMPRPNLNLVNKYICEEAWIDYFSSDNIEFQNKWRKHYNEQAGRILIEPSFVAEARKKQELEDSLRLLQAMEDSNSNSKLGENAKSSNDKDSNKKPSLKKPAVKKPIVKKSITK
ncbi:Uncharacterised protein [Helicobacter muridarum]|uniref:Uncharacterized protein n=2 Tax=Helicobacter muridarum TaxID=216 RepID=A0A377PU86_9HELI|nr:Uncharacterised protein [Helicobacter muridarum]